MLELFLSHVGRESKKCPYNYYSKMDFSAVFKCYLLVSLPWDDKKLIQ